jgi:uncharacterized protein DUF6886
VILYHFSEDPTIERFVPRPMETRPGEPARVWAIDEEHAPLYWFARDCPRVSCWAAPTSTPEDIARFLGRPPARMVIAIEGGWLARMQGSELYAYRLPDDRFLRLPPHQGSGYYVAYEPVVPLSVEPVGDLLARHVQAGIELRIMPSLWSLNDAIIASTLDFGMIRMRNAQRDRAEVL